MAKKNSTYFCDAIKPGSNKNNVHAQEYAQ